MSEHIGVLSLTAIVNALLHGVQPNGLFPESVNMCLLRELDFVQE